KVGGENVKDLSLSVLRKEVAVVPQFSTLFSETVRANLLWGNENADEEHIQKALHTACADEFVENLSDGIDTFLARGGKNLSGGQKQRLCIARALIKEPKILLLDDSLSAVDTKTDALIRERLAKNYPDTTTVIIAQRIKSVKNADKIYVIDGGKIVAEGTHKTLSQSNEIYKEIMDSQKEVADE
ncbi:MAG: ABC transporter ATP-binding protein, partial [Clostridia bacterium]|nr:ABC transporter ATP-binding protein [Clostridia bacterium]